MKSKILWTIIGAVGLVVILTVIALAVPQFPSNIEQKGDTSNYNTPGFEATPPKPVSEAYASKDEDLQLSSGGELANEAISPPLGSNNATSIPVLIQLDKMLKKEGYVTIEADKPKEASSKLALIASKFGGDILDSNSSNSGGFLNLSLTIRVAAQNYEKALAEIQQLGEVTSLSSTSEDVSSEYIDLKARLLSAEKYKDILMGFLSRAKSVEESLMVSDRIRGLDSEIESYKGQIKYIEGMTSFSRIHITVTGSGGSVTINDEDSFFVVGLKKAWRAFQQAVLWILQFILVLLPIAIIVCLIIWGVLALVKRFNSHPKA